jgi:transposase
MKTLDTLLKKREELRIELEFYQNNRIYVPTPFSDNWKLLSNEEKKAYGRALKIIRELKLQINALTYVINYDSELEDVTAEPILKHI